MNILLTDDSAKNAEFGLIAIDSVIIKYHNKVKIAAIQAASDKQKYDIHMENEKKISDSTWFHVPNFSHPDVQAYKGHPAKGLGPVPSDGRHVSDWPFDGTGSERRAITMSENLLSFKKSYSLLRDDLNRAIKFQDNDFLADTKKAIDELFRLIVT